MCCKPDPDLAHAVFPVEGHDANQGARHASHCSPAMQEILRAGSLGQSRSTDSWSQELALEFRCLYCICVTVRGRCRERPCTGNLDSAPCCQLVSFHVAGCRLNGSLIDGLSGPSPNLQPDAALSVLYFWPVTCCLESRKRCAPLPRSSHLLCSVMAEGWTLEPGISAHPAASGLMASRQKAGKQLRQGVGRLRWWQHQPNTTSRGWPGR